MVRIQILNLKKFISYLQILPTFDIRTLNKAKIWYICCWISWPSLRMAFFILLKSNLTVFVDHSNATKSPIASWTSKKTNSETNHWTVVTKHHWVDWFALSCWSGCFHSWLCMSFWEGKSKGKKCINIINTVWTRYLGYVFTYWLFFVYSK